MKKRPRKHPFLSVLLFFVLIIAWILFTPVQLGGRTSYVIIRGSSMETKFHLGDLVIVRTSGEYNVGEVVAYQHPDIGPVFHRIVDLKNGRYSLQGDNNNWIDSYSPTFDEIIGKTWFHLPGLGSVVLSLREPSHFALLVFGLLLITFYPNQEMEKGFEKTRSKISMTFNQKIKEYLFVLVVVISLLVILAVISFSQPLTTNYQESVRIQHVGVFRYYSQSNPNIYDGEEAQIGDPVFLKISDALDISFNYRGDKNLLTNPVGTYQMIARIKEQSGWYTTIVIVPETQFEGHDLSISGTLDLDEIQTRTQFFESQTDIIRPVYTLSIEPTINISGLMGSQTVETSFSPILDFYLDPVLIKLANEGDEDQINPVAFLPVFQEQELPNVISIFSLKIPVAVVRIGSIFMIFAVLGLAVFYAFLYIDTLRAGGDKAIAFLYRDIIVLTDKFPEKIEMIRVTTFDNLLKMAFRHNSNVVMNVKNNGHDYYYIDGSEVVYYYVIVPPSGT